MATQLGLFNAALIEIGSEVVTTTADAVKSARTLTAVYTETVGECLEAGLWQFAMRSVEVDADPTPPTFGYQYAFSKPSDWVRTAMLSGAERFDPPLDDFEDETAFWMADIDPIFVRYVSNDTDYGLDLDLWPQRFTRFVVVSLAMKVCLTLTGNKTLLDTLAERTVPKARSTALAVDAVNGPPRFPPAGRLVRSRFGDRRIRLVDRG